MRFHKSNILLICSATALQTACDLYEPVPNYETVLKTPIELTIGDADGPMVSRALITDGTDKTLSPFANDAKIFMVMKSTYGTADYQGSHEAKYTVTRGNVEKAVTTTVNEKPVNPVAFTPKNWRYWDDAHARSSQLNIWAYAQMGTGSTEEANTTTFGSQTFNTTEAPDPQWTSTAIEPTIAWKASTESDGAQNATTVLTQDLLFSNNLVDNSAAGTNLGGTDASLKFNFTTRKFPKVGEAQMIFYHALAKITVRINEGDGFNPSSTADFKFSSGNVTLKNFNTQGTFSIKDGAFTSVSHADVPQISCPVVDDGGTGYTLEALAVPNTGSTDAFSRCVKDKKALTNDDVMMEFTIDDNKYQITSGMLYDALHVDGDPTKALVTNAVEKTDNGKYIPLEAGKNYIFTFTVGKTKIKNLTAQVVNWADVTAETLNPSNARIKLQLEERGTAQNSDVAFYKKEDNNTGSIDDNYAAYNWKSGYANLNATFSAGYWTSNFFWQSNKDFYHFRALMPAATGVTTESTEGDYVTLASGSTYTDVRWGAPMLDVADNTVSDATTLKWQYGHTTNGFDAKDDGTVASGLPAGTLHQIYKAIGPTEDAIKLVLFHMMSDLTFNVTTTTGDDKVTLDDGANKTKVEIVGFYPGGKVLLGNGLVKTTGSTGDATVSWNSEDPTGTHVYKFGAVPQNLTSVKLRITTPDNNQYFIDLKDATVKAITSNDIENPYSVNDKITRWYPGFKYVYNIQLKKTGITKLTATIVDWGTITAEDETVEIK